MPERFEDAVKALRHVARGNGVVLRIADRIEVAHWRELAAAREEGRQLVTDESGHWLGGEEPPEVTRPITRGLREKLNEWERTDGGTSHVSNRADQAGYDRMVQLCNDVDSVHARLEDEHAALVFKYETITGALRRIGEAMRDDL